MNAIDPAGELEQVRQRFLARARAETLTISELCQVLMHAPQSQRERPLQSIATLLHRLAGTGGTLGFRALGDLARMLERIGLTMLRYPEEGFAARLIELCEGSTELLRIIESVNPADAILSDAAGKPAPKANPDTSLVCVVSRDAELSRRLHVALEGLGHNVLEFASTGELARKAGALDVSAIVVKLDAGEDHLAGLARLRATQKYPSPIVVVGEDIGFGDYLAAVRAAADGYFAMPLNLPRLEGRIRHLIERGRGDPFRVLLVDDDAEFLAACKAILEDAGMHVQTLQDPSVVLEKLAEFRAEVILADIQMPQCTGPELAQVIRMHEEWAHVPIVYVSGDACGADQLLATRKAGEAFVSKPLDPRELVATVCANGRHARQVSETVSRDSLTGVLKRSFIQEYLVFELERALRSGGSTSVAMIDIDSFKAINDEHGHPVGDLVIRTLAAVLRQRLRASDGVGRVGGEEFLAVLPNCGADEAKAIMESALQRFSEIRFSSPVREFSCTFSAGIAESTAGALSESQLVGLADESLYKAKRAGRNRIVCAHPRDRRPRLHPSPAS